MASMFQLRSIFFGQTLYISKHLRKRKVKLKEWLWPETTEPPYKIVDEMTLQLWWLPVRLPAKQGGPQPYTSFAPAAESSDPSLEVLPLWHKGPSDRHLILFINLLAGWRGKCRSVGGDVNLRHFSGFCFCLARSEQVFGNGSPGGGGVRRERKVGAGLWPAGEEPLLTRSVWPIEWPECDKCRFILPWKARDSTA